MESQNYQDQHPHSQPYYAHQHQGGAAPKAMPPKTWLLESILVTVFCCLPFGIVGIVYAAHVESHFYAGHIEASERASRDAKKWTAIGFFVGLAFLVLYVLLMVVGVVGGILGTGAALNSFY